MAKQKDPADQEWIDKLDAPALAAFKSLVKKKTLQKALKNEVNLATSRAIRRLMKQNGHPLTAPEGVDLTNATVVTRWVLDTWTSVPRHRKLKNR